MLFDYDRLFAFSNDVLSRLHVPPNQAREVSACLLDANLRGIDSHGIVRLPVYAKRLQAGVINAKPSITITKNTGPLRIINGDNGLGPVVGTFAMHQAIEAAKEFGVGLVTAHRSNHYGAAGYYTEMAVSEGCLGVTTSNAPPNMAPYGGRTRFLGTNPLAIGIPTEKHDPLVFDMATSVVARGKIILAAQKGENIPEGWAIDPEGHPTTDATAALQGAVLPFGGAKGSAISLILDVLSGVLSGAAYGKHLNTLEDLHSEQNVGHFFLAIDVGHFMPFAVFTERIDDLLSQLKDVPPAPNFERVLAPGDIERTIMNRRRTEGMPLTQDVITQLADLGAEVDLALPHP